MIFFYLNFSCHSAGPSMMFYSILLSGKATLLISDRWSHANGSYVRYIAQAQRTQCSYYVIHTSTDPFLLAQGIAMDCWPMSAKQQCSVSYWLGHIHFPRIMEIFSSYNGNSKLLATYVWLICLFILPGSEKKISFLVYHVFGCPIPAGKYFASKVSSAKKVHNSEYRPHL